MNTTPAAIAAAEEAVGKLESEQIRYFEEVEAIAGENAGEAFDAALRQAHRPQITLMTDGQSVGVGGHSKLQRSVQRRENSRFRVEVRAVDRDGRPNGTAKLKVLEVEGDEAKTRFVTGRTYSVHLRTRSDLRSLELLGHAWTRRLQLRVEVGVWVNLRARSNLCSYWLRSFDEEDLIEQIKKSGGTIVGGGQS